MAKKVKFKTRSQAGNAILGVLCLLCGAGLLLLPCVGVGLALIGKMTPPTNNAQDLLGALCVLGLCLAMAFATLGLGVLCLHATILPKTLQISDDGLLLFWGKKKLGEVPFANVKDVMVKTRAMAGQTANSAFWQGFLQGGLIGGAMARSRFDPNESVGIVIRLADPEDADTFWPKGLFKSDKKKRLEVDYCWELSHTKLVEKIATALSRHKQDESLSEL
jgi:hypothetical protein